MLIKIHSSRLFDTEPARRFAVKYNVSPDLWCEIWKRYKLLQYTVPDLADYFHLKVQKQIKRRNISRWIFLTEIYFLVQPARDMGVRVINTEMFGDWEERVIQEITRHLKDGSTHSSNIMV